MEGGDLDTALFNRIKREFGDRGVYAVNMLQTAKILLAMHDQAPYMPAAAIACIRQAAEEIFSKKGYDQHKWKKITEHVLNARDRILDERNPTCAEIYFLISATHELDEFKNSDDKQKFKIRKFVERKTGKNDPSIETNFTLYQNLMSELNRNLHAIKGDMLNDPIIANNLYRKTMDVLRTIILPFWFNDIEQLARKEDPSPDDAEALKKFMSNRYDLEWFISQMKSTEWLNLMDRDMLRPPSDGSRGLLPHILVNLKDEHYDTFVHLIEENWDEWTKDDAGLNEICRVALHLGARGLPFVAKALRNNSSSSRLCHFAWMACRSMDARDHQIVELADMLLHPEAALEGYQVNDVAKKLVDGMYMRSSKTRIDILVSQFQNSLATDTYFSSIGSIADLAKIMPSVLTYLAANLCNALKKAHILGKPIADLIAYLNPLPQGIQSRFVACLYSGMEDPDCPRVVDFIVVHCLGRDPTGDDVLLLERLEQDCNTKIIAERLADALDTPPTSNELDGILQLRSRHPRFKTVKWVAVIANGINLVGWETCLERLSALGMNREAIRNHPVVSTSQTTHFSQTEFELTEPKYIAKKIASLSLSAEDGLSLSRTYGIRSDLEDAIKRNPSRWAKDPMGIISALRHPMYITSYFRALATAEAPLDSYATMLIRSIEFASTHPYHVIIQSSSLYYDDHSWMSTDIAGMTLIRELVRSDTDLDDGSLSRIWMLVLKGTTCQIGRSEDAASESIQSMEDYLSADLNYVYPCALHVILFLIQYARKRDYAIPNSVFEKLGESLTLPSRIGAECRAVLATHVGLLRNVMPDWMDQNESFLFGNDAPENMAKLSLYMHIMADNPDKFVLERYQSNVLDAVRKDIGRAMCFLIQGMLWGIDGYTPESVASSIGEMGAKYISLAGKTTAEMLSSSSQDSIRLGVDFWLRILALSPTPEALRGYGRWYCLTALEQDEWERMMLQSCQQSNGNIDFAGEVAERISLSTVITNSGLKILILLMKNGGDYFDREIVADHAWTILKKSKYNTDLTESWNLLHIVMRESGYQQCSS